MAISATTIAIPAAPVRAASPWGTPGVEPHGASAASLELEPGAAEPTSDAAPAAVVGLDADAPREGEALTQALRRAFAARGLSGGEEIGLPALRTALGCKGDDPECLAKAGPRLGARRIIYGTLRKGEGGAWALALTLVEVEGGATTTAELSLTDADLAADRIDGTADAAAARLAPDVAVSDAPAQGTGGLAMPPPPPPDPLDDGLHDDEDRAAGEGEVRWGWVKPQPRWKWAGFGVGVGLTVAGTAAAIGTAVWLTSKDGGFRRQLLDAANASLNDDNPLNDVDPRMSGDLCAYAREQTDPSQPNAIRNAAVTQVCLRAEKVQRAQRGSAVVAGVGLVTTVVFTVLLFRHREPARTSTWHRRGLYVGVDPVRGQGATLRMGGRF